MSIKRKTTIPDSPLGLGNLKVTPALIRIFIKTSFSYRQKYKRNDMNMFIQL